VLIGSERKPVNRNPLVVAFFDPISGSDDDDLITALSQRWHELGGEDFDASNTRPKFACPEQ
jgi:hypothetical protein